MLFVAETANRIVTVYARRPLWTSVQSAVPKPFAALQHDGALPVLFTTHGLGLLPATADYVVDSDHERVSELGVMGSASEFRMRSMRNCSSPRRHDHGHARRLRREGFAPWR